MALYLPAELNARIVSEARDSDKMNIVCYCESHFDGRQHWNPLFHVWRYNSSPRGTLWARAGNFGAWKGCPFPLRSHEAVKAFVALTARGMVDLDLGIVVFTGAQTPPDTFSTTCFEEFRTCFPTYNIAEHYFAELEQQDEDSDDDEDAAPKRVTQHFLEDKFSLIVWSLLN